MWNDPSLLLNMFLKLKFAGYFQLQRSHKKRSYKAG